MPAARARPCSRAFASIASFALSVSVVGHCFLAPVARAESVDDLLNQADRALGGGSPTPSTKNGTQDESGARKNPRRQRKDSESSEAGSRPKTNDHSGSGKDAGTTPGGVGNDGPPRVEPSPELKGVMNIDTNARLKEAREGDVTLIVGIGLGIHSLPRGFAFTKDDDVFALSGVIFPIGGKLSLAIKRRRPFEVPMLVDAGLALRPIAALDIGYFAGAAAADRTGVQSGRANYSYKIIPVVVKGGLSLAVRETWGARLFLGVGADVINQTGAGVTDTGTEIFRGLVVAPQMFLRLSDALALRLAAEFLGLGLPLLSPKANGRELTVGLDLSL